MNLQIQDLGLCSYKEVWDLQKNIQADRIAGKDQDTLLLVEHTPVYTFGKNSDKNHLLQHYPENVQIFHIERGGDITFHGPGQLVGYPILDLNNYKKSISWYMRSLEEVIIDTLDIYGLVAIRKDGLTGVWIGDEKIAALGVRISRWVTMHGFALNVNTDLNYYDGIIPCGILEYGVTSMEKLLGCKISMDDIKNNLISCFRNIFINELIPVNL
ncbi:MAG TPA: lipoyl(octanoyl) transferase [Candidatus Marinimicrobia bacterium]|nr:lipoyl(octanoyl) transferase [Candidatus Neomarinimicrobiota bacterium]|tara:strand:- start:3481 stop:4122 length:642 start_codon:yes stop_codon:yes gene_type:complete